MRPGVVNQPINMLPLIYTSLLLGCGEIAGMWAVQAQQAWVGEGRD